MHANGSSCCTIAGDIGAYSAVPSKKREDQEDLRRKKRHRSIAATSDRLEALKDLRGIVLRRENQKRDDHREENYDHVRSDEAFK